VLALGEDTNLPLLERVRYLAIVAANLDEFFQVEPACASSSPRSR
jgi:polyphosphate kinase